MPPDSVAPINVCVSHMFVQRAFHPRSRGQKRLFGAGYDELCVCLTAYLTYFHTSDCPLKLDVV